MDNHTPTTDTPTTDTPTARLLWSRMGGQLGVGLCAFGFLLVFLGWNGAASLDRLPSQFPYLISGGIAGLCFVVLGVGMLVVQNQRADRAALQATLRELQEALERAGLAQGTGDERKPFAKPGPRPTPVADVEHTDHGGAGDHTMEIPLGVIEEAPPTKPARRRDAAAESAPAKSAARSRAAKRPTT